MSGICSISECGRRAIARGWCRRHYEKWKRHGDPERSVKTPDGAPLRFLLEAVSYLGDECRTFPFATVGYGKVRYEERVWTVSRLMCQLVNGTPPTPKHEASHSCGNGHIRCITPRHLRWRTPSENQLERVVHGTSNRGERHGNSRLTESDVKEILRRIDAGQSQMSIADRFRIGQVTVSNIRLGKTWGWLTGRADQ